MSGASTESSTTPPRRGRPNPVRWIPKFLLGASARLWCVRWVIATGIVTLYYSVWLFLLLETFGKLVNRLQVTYAVAVSAITLFHHLGCAFGPRFFPLPTWMDLILTLFEFSSHMYLQIYLLVLKNRVGLEYNWFPKRAVFGLIGIWALTISLFCALILKIAKLAGDRGSSFKRRVDMYPSHGRQSSLSWWKYPYYVLLGRRPWEEKLPGEGSWIQYLRGMATISVILIVAIFGAYETIIAPIAEMGLTPNREYRAEFFPNTFTTSTPVVWDVLMLWYPRAGAPKQLIDVSSVVPEWGTNSGDPGEPDFPSCTRTAVNGTDWYVGFEKVAFRCGRRPLPASLSDPKSIGALYAYPDRTRPNLYVRVNFTELMGPSEQIGTRASMIWDSVSVFVALSEDIEDVLSATRPTPLFPGTNVIGVTNLYIRQRLRPRELATLGFELSRTYMAADIAYTANNPFMGGVSPSPNVSDMRIISPINPPEFTIVQDYRNKSILVGFSAIGGLASFFSTLLALVLGANLMKSVLRSKPYSPFGLIHNLDMEQRQMAEECARRYPALREDIETLAKNPGIIAFLFDTLIDIDPLGSSEGPPQLLRKIGTKPGTGGSPDEKLESSEVEAGQTSSRSEGDEEFDPYAEFAEDPTSMPGRTLSLRRAIYARTNESG